MIRIVSRLCKVSKYPAKPNLYWDWSIVIDNYHLPIEILYTELFLPHVYFAHLNFQVVSPCLEFAQTVSCVERDNLRHLSLPTDNEGKRGENKIGANISPYTVTRFGTGGSLVVWLQFDGQLLYGTCTPILHNKQESIFFHLVFAILWRKSASYIPLGPRGQVLWHVYFIIKQKKICILEVQKY